MRATRSLEVCANEACVRDFYPHLIPSKRFREAHGAIRGIGSGPIDPQRHSPHPTLVTLERLELPDFVASETDSNGPEWRRLPVGHAQPIYRKDGA